MRRISKSLACAVTALSAVGLAITGLAAGSAGAATTASAATVRPGPWAQAGYNAADSNANLGENTLTPSTAPSARYLRSIYAPPRPLADCNPGGVLAAPLLSGGYVYVTANYTLSKYQASDGTLVWSADLSSPQSDDVPRSIGLSGDDVVLGSSDCGSVSDPSGRLQAFSAATGQALWNTTIGPGNGPLNSMGIASGIVVTSGSSPGGGTVVGAFQASTGKQVWLKGGDECGQGPALVVGGYVVFVTCDDSDQSGTELEAVSLATGQQAWADAGDWQVMAGDRSTSAGTHVFARKGSTVYDVTAATGATQYSLSGATNILAVGPADVYASTATGLAAYHLSDGSQAWSTFDDGQVAAEAGGLVYAADGNVLNASTGALVTRLWSSQATRIVVGEGRAAVVTDPRAVDLYGLAGS